MVKIKWYIGVLWVVITILLTVFLIKQPDELLINVPLVLGWILFLLQLTWAKSEKFYLYWKRFIFNLKNPESLWNMRVTFQGDYDRTYFKKIDDLFYQYNKDIHITLISNTRKLYRVGSISFEVSINENQGEVNFTIHDLEVSYRRSKNIIEKELNYMFEKIQMELRPKHGDYHLAINFKGFNPYFGFFVRRLNANEIIGFDVTFFIEKDRVAVSKTGIEINTDTIGNLNILSKEYLALSPR